LVALGLDFDRADMDAVLGVTQSPPLLSALDWLAGSTPAPGVVVVSNHEELLKQMRAAKLAGQHPEKFAAVYFVYLRKPKAQLQSHLRLPTAGGVRRPDADQQYTLDHYERFDALFAELADCTLECSSRSVAEIAGDISEVAQQQAVQRGSLAAPGRDGCT
jgi:hypothetical protein